MSGTERSDSGAFHRSAIAGESDDACIAADSGIEEKTSTMQMIKDLIAAPAAESSGKARTECPPSGMPADWQGHLGSQLRALYGSLVNEPVPDKFYHLLKELEAKELQAKEQEEGKS